MPVEKRRDILRLQAYPEGTAGAVMTTEVARLPESLTVRQALEELSRIAENLETIYYIYIVDDDNHLRGAVSARQLVTHLNKPNMPITDLMERNLVTVEATDDQEAVAKKVADYDFLAIPVVDHEQHLVGIITHDDVIDVLQREATEDAYLAGAVGPIEEGYLSIPWFEFTRHRAPWLAILFGGAIMTILALQVVPRDDRRGRLAGAVSAADRLLRRQFRQPVGDAHHSRADDQRNHARRLVGRCLARTADRRCTRACFSARSATSSAASSRRSHAAALVIPITLILVVTCGTLVGSLLPLLFARLGWDPALMSTPFVTVHHRHRGHRDLHERRTADAERAVVATAAVTLRRRERGDSQCQMPRRTSRRTHA